MRNPLQNVKKTPWITFKSPLFLVYETIWLPLHKIGGTRQFENKFSLHSFALSLHKIGGTRQFENKLSLHSFALSLHKMTMYGKIFSDLSWQTRHKTLLKAYPKRFLTRFTTTLSVLLVENATKNFSKSWKIRRYGSSVHYIIRLLIGFLPFGIGTKRHWW